MIFSEQELREYFKFTFVRNPWDRLVSAYHFLRDGGLDHGPRHWPSVHLSPYADFEDFVLRGLARWEIRRWYHFRPQVEYIKTHWSDELSMDYVGRMESLEHDYKVVADRLQRSPLLGRVNEGKSRRPDYRSYFSPRTRAIVERVLWGGYPDIRLRVLNCAILIKPNKPRGLGSRTWVRKRQGTNRSQSKAEEGAMGTSLRRGRPRLCVSWRCSAVKTRLG